MAIEWKRKRARFPGVGIKGITSSATGRLTGQLLFRVILVPTALLAALMVAGGCAQNDVRGSNPRPRETSEFIPTGHPILLLPPALVFRSTDGRVVPRPSGLEGEELDGDQALRRALLRAGRRSLETSGLETTLPPRDPASLEALHDFSVRYAVLANLESASADLVAIAQRISTSEADHALFVRLTVRLTDSAAPGTSRYEVFILSLVDGQRVWSRELLHRQLPTARLADQNVEILLDELQL